ncbi:GTP-binding protein [Cupriavidus basilensis]
MSERRVNIDGAVLALQDGVPMATLSNGCVCCSLTNDLPYTIDALVRERRPVRTAPYTQIIPSSAAAPIRSWRCDAQPQRPRRPWACRVGLAMTTYACTTGTSHPRTFPCSRGKVPAGAYDRC